MTRDLTDAHPEERLLAGKAIARECLNASTASRVSVAAALGRARSRIDAFLDDEHVSGVPAHDLALFTEHVGPGYLEAIAAAAGYRLVPVIDGESSPADTVGTAAATIRETGEAVAAALAAIADGKVAPSELALCRREIEEAHRALGELLARVQAAAV